MTHKSWNASRGSKKPVIHVEGAEQVALVNCSNMRQWGTYFFHVPNERVNKLEAIRGKFQGVCAGVPGQLAGSCAGNMPIPNIAAWSSRSCGGTRPSRR